MLVGVTLLWIGVLLMLYPPAMPANLAGIVFLLFSVLSLVGSGGVLVVRGWARTTNWWRGLGALSVVMILAATFIARVLVTYGDCVDDDGWSVPCGTAGSYTVVASIEYPADMRYPGGYRFQVDAGEECPDDPAVLYFRPSSEGWAEGDRTLFCAVPNSTDDSTVEA